MRYNSGVNNGFSRLKSFENNYINNNNLNDEFMKGRLYDNIRSKKEF